MSSRFVVGRIGKRMAAYAPKIEPPSLKRYMSTTTGGGEDEVKQHDSFCLRAFNQTTHMTEWYILEVDKIDKDMRNKSKRHEQILPIASGMFGVESMYVPFRSSLYCFGGIYRDQCDASYNCYQAEMYVLDTNCLQKGFLKGPPMFKDRANTSPVTLRNKIYVFGGFDTMPGIKVDPHPFGEYFDPKLGEWHPISQPPKHLLPKFLAPNFVFRIDKQNIAVGESDPVLKLNKVLLYNVVKDSWAHLNYRIPLTRGHGPPIKVGNTLYWLNGILHAYDLNNHMSYSTPIRGSLLLVDFSGTELTYPSYEAFFHLGGANFCFFHMLEEGRTNSVIYCTKFRVVKKKGVISDATAFSVQSYITSGNSFLVDGLPLNDTCIVQTSHTGMTAPKMKRKKCKIGVPLL